MHDDTIGAWEQTQAELEIRRWLYTIGLWAPGAERWSAQQTEDTFPAELTEPEIDQVLRSEVVGRIGCHADGKTYVVPITYVYDGEAIYAHSGEGLKLHMLRANPAVCFEVDHVVSLTNWQSVIAWGQFEELHGAASDRAMSLLAERIKPLLPGHADQALPGDSDAGHGRPVVYRFRLTERTGRADTR